QSIDECWELISTFEETGFPCMMLENWSFRRDNLAVLNMIREGLLGETVHSQCSYSHHCVSYFFDGEGNPRWQGKFLMKYNRDQYPTHGLGPVLSWLNINCGDQFDTLVSVSTDPFGVEQYYRDHFAKDGAAKAPKVQQGDIVSTLIKTKQGKTIYITNDMFLPRPYDNRWMVQGTKGIYSFERDSVYLEGKSPQSHAWEEFAPYQEKYDHRFWKDAPENVEQLGHGGPDYIELAEFVRAVRTQSPTPLNLYDSVAMSSVVALSGQSIAQKNAPVMCPDFTRGKWKTNKPSFGIS
ncbi:MAG: gfo/Idh/MocA family oxidoreductase, partial [Candidatus Hinthialibacter sp.]